MNTREIADRLLCTIFPARCVICGCITEYDDYWCKKCHLSRHGIFEYHAPHLFKASLAAFEYESCAKNAVLMAKKNSDLRAVRFLAAEVSKLVNAEWGDIAFDYIIAVPPVEKSTKKRRLNHAQAIAQEMSQILKIPVAESVLYRRSTGRKQHELTAPQRLKNAFESYGITASPLLQEKTILLVDDVFTSGATALACSELLVKENLATVYVATAAYTI